MSSATEVTVEDVAQLRGMISGYMVSQVISVTAALGLADILAKGATSADALAKQTETHPEALTRLLRSLAVLGLVEPSDTGLLQLTPLGALLRSDAPGSLRAIAIMAGGGGIWRAWGDLLHTVRTGETAFNHVFGMGSFEYSSLHPERAAMFDAYMAGHTLRAVPAILAAYDFSCERHIVDVGGGNGILLSAILVAAPKMKGIVFDIAAGLKETRRRLEEADVSERCSVVAGDFFKSVPSGAETYILKSILHDWNDAQCVVILKNCYDAMRADSTLVIIERVMPEPASRSDVDREAVMMDVHMMVARGRERTILQYKQLLAAAGLTATAAKPTASPFTVLSAAKGAGGPHGM